jgi:hypothetical protein
MTRSANGAWTGRPDAAPILPEGTATRCHRCQQPAGRGELVEVAVEQGTSASLVYIHRRDCRAQPVRRHP